MKCFIKRALCLSLMLCGVSNLANASAVDTLDWDKVVADSTIMMSNKFVKNWELTVMLGAQTFQAEYSQFSKGPFKLKDSWRFTGDVSLVKWASPYFGLGLGFTGAGYKGVYTSGDIRTTFAKSTDPWYPGSEGQFHVATGTYGNVFAKATVNFSNLFAGFRADRRFEVTGYAGGGVIFPMCKVEYNRATGATFNAGVNAQVRLTKHLFITAAVRGALISDGFNGISYITSGDRNNVSLDGQIGGLIGISYKFGYSSRKNQKTGRVKQYEWLPAPVVFATSETVKEMVDTEVKEAELKKDAEIEVANENIKELRKENERISQALEESNKKAPVVQPKDYWQYISFNIDKTNIINSEMVNIMSAADYIKASPDEKFVINGFADKQTATSEHNVGLANGRAKAVYDALVNKFGVNPEQLEYQGNGGVDYMYYNDVKCSRCVIISTKK